MKIFIDSNIILHFTPLDSINWKDVVDDVSDLSLVFPLTVISEIDKHKRNNKYRDRAVQFLKKIEAADKSGELKLNVKVEIIKSGISEKTIQENDLNRSEKDDLIIASIIEYRVKSHGIKMLLLTDDSSLRLRSSVFGIECVELPDKYELKEEDEQVKEIKKLKTELQKLQSAIPKLKLEFDTGGENSFIEIEDPIFDAFKEEELRKIRSKHHTLPHGDLEFYRRAPGLSNLIVGDIYVYNDKVEKFYTAYEKYLKEIKPIYLDENLTFNIKLKLTNSGTAPANSIDVELVFPDNLLVRINPKFEYPESPIPPILQKVQTNFSNPMASYPNLKPEKEINWGPAYIKMVDNHYEGKVVLPSLKHNQDFIIDQFYLTFTDYQLASGLSIEVRMYADNIPSVVTQTLNIRLFKDQISKS